MSKHEHLSETPAGKQSRSPMPAYGSRRDDTESALSHGIDAKPVAPRTLSLSRLIGNRAVQALVQLKLRVASSDDPLEREADRVADEATLHDGHIEVEPCVRSAQRLARKGSGSGASDGEIVNDSSFATLGSGAPLDHATREWMQPRLGRDFSDVRVHTGTAASQAAQSIEARAFTFGHDIVFGRGEYQPNSAGGRNLVAHELAHVMQQSATSGSYVTATPFIQRLKKQPEQGTLIQTYPQWGALPFVPDHPFYELLAHDVAYRAMLDGQFLYQAAQAVTKAAAPTPATSFGPDNMKPAGAEGHALPKPNVPEPPLGLLDFLWRPQSLPDGFAVLRRPPELPKGGKVLYYEIHSLENIPEGLFVYYMIPSLSSAPRIVVFRGTEPDKLDIGADADPAGVGKTVFDNNRVNIEDMLKKVNARPGSGTVLTGHSLGGALAQWATVAFPSKVQETVTFNSPGISKVEAANLPIGKNAPKVSHYVTRGDLVSAAGEKLIEGTITVMEGGATREVEDLFNNGRIYLAEKALKALPPLVALLASAWFVDIASKIDLILKFVIFHRDGLDALKDLGGLLGALHSQRLLRSSLVPPPYARLPGIFPLDAANLRAETGKVKKTVSSDQVAVPQIETARAGLGMSKPFKGTLLTIFEKTIPLIKSLTLSKALRDELLEINSPIRTIARQIKPILGPVLSQMALAGGLANMVRLAVNYQPEDPEKKRETLDALKVVKTYPNLYPNR